MGGKEGGFGMGSSTGGTAANVCMARRVKMTRKVVTVRRECRVMVEMISVTDGEF
jgi:hypothetical protein